MMFDLRGYRLDASSGRIPTMRTLRFLVDILSRYRYNRFEFLLPPETEAENPDVWEVPDRPSAADLAKLSAYAEFQGIELLLGQSAESIEELSNGEAAYRFENEAELLRKTGKPFVIAPKTSADCSLAGRVENMRENLENAERAGRLFGAKGLMIDDPWTGAGWEPLVVSLPAIILGGNFASSGAKASHMDLEKELNSVLDAPLAGYVLKLGTLYMRGGAIREGASELYNILAHPIGYSRHPGLTPLILDEISGIASGVRIAAERWTDRSEWAKEIVYMADLVDAACHRRDESRLRALRDEHGRVWKQRFREGGRIASMMKLPRF